MLDILAEELAAWFLGLIFRRVPPIEVEVEVFEYQLMRSDPYDKVSVVTPYPKRYRAELKLMNRQKVAVSVKDIALLINNEEHYEPSGDVTKIRLEAHDAMCQDIVFPVPDRNIPAQQGNFRLTVIPAAGRKTTVTGRFPIQND